MGTVWVAVVLDFDKNYQDKKHLFHFLGIKLSPRANL